PTVGDHPDDSVRVFGRRRLLQALSLATASGIAAPFSAQTQTTQEPARTPILPPPAGEIGQPSATASTQTTGGADFMIDMIRKLGIEHTVATPGNTFKGLHESLINYGMVT